MAEYIERERARFEFERFFKGNETVQHDCDSLLCMFPAADVAPVVRCKDCVRCGFCGDATNLEVMGFYGYCSRGERRDMT